MNMDNIKKRKRTVHDLGQVHTVLVSLATEFQLKVERDIQGMMEMGSKLAHEMNASADSLEIAGDIELPSNCHTFSLSSSMSPTSPACQAILSINMFREAAVSTLRSQAKALSSTQVPVKSESTEDFVMASENIDTSLQQLTKWKDQLSTTSRTLEQCSNDCGLLEQIDNLELQAVLDKMVELRSSNCSLQSRKPESSLVYERYLQKIMLLAKNAKSLIYEVRRQTMKASNLVTREEIAVTNIYSKHLREVAELLRRRRYEIFLKLEIKQGIPKKSKK